MPMTTSRSITRSCSNASVSSVTGTEPSMAFSMGTKPTSTVPAAVAASTSGMDGNGTCRRARRSGWVSMACSVKVPIGPKNPTDADGWGTLRPGSRGRWTSGMRQLRSRPSRIVTWMPPPSPRCSMP